MTIVTRGSDEIVEQITKQLNKLVDVVKVVDLSEGRHIERELMLVKVRAAGKDREEMKRLCDIFRGRIIDVTDQSYTVELTGTTDKLDAFLEALDKGAILETVRTGVSGIGRGEWVLVHAPAGGVGSALVQLAARAGCRVVGVVGGAHKVAAARALGAELVIDRSQPGLWEQARRAVPAGFAAIFDANGVSTLRARYQHLAPPGRLVVYGFHSMLPRQGGRPNYLKLAIDYVRTPWFSAMDLVNHNKSVLGFNLSYMFHREDLLREAMARILGGFAEGALRMPAVATYRLEEVARAHADLESGRTVGKLVLLP